MCAFVLLLSRLLYKLRGIGVTLNLPMSDEQKAKLDAMGLQELIQSFHLRGGDRSSSCAPVGKT
jgi:hypothetical protein